MVTGSKRPNRYIFLATLIGCVMGLSPITTHAAEGTWDDRMRGSGIVVDHQPYNSGGLPSDTLYRENEFLPPTWQLVADDFTVGDSAAIRKINFWGFYDHNLLPASDQTFRVRISEQRPQGGLPGSVLYEQED